MAAEIERKFLVRSDGWRAGVVHAERLRDGLIARASGTKVRVRLGDGRAWLAVKGPKRGLTRAEFEYEIPVSDAQAMMAGLRQGEVVEKTRHCVPLGDVIFAVDVHHGALAGLVTADVELTSETQPVPSPEWLGADITHDPRYAKTALLAHGLAAPV